MSIRIVAPVVWLLTVVVSALSWPLLPSRVPVHWNIRGEADGWGSKWELLLLGPGLTLVFGVLFVVLERVDPRVRAGEDDPGPRRALFDVALALMAAIHVVILGHVTGVLHDLNRAMALVLAGFLVVGGNVMARIRPNWFAGIRTPWTLSSDEVWRKTHRMGGHAMFAAGIVAALLALVVPATIALPVAIVLTLVSTLAPAAYSYVLWRERKA